MGGFVFCLMLFFLMVVVPEICRGRKCSDTAKCILGRTTLASGTTGHPLLDHLLIVYMACRSSMPRGHPLHRRGAFVQLTNLGDCGFLDPMDLTHLFDLSLLESNEIFELDHD